MDAQFEAAQRLMMGSDRTEDLLVDLDLWLSDDDVALLTLDLDRLSQAVRRVARVSDAPRSVAIAA